MLGVPGAAHGDGAERGPLWIFGCNDHLNVEVPDKFERTGMFKKDFEKVCKLVGAIPHPALKSRPAKPKSRRPSHLSPGMQPRRSVQPAQVDDEEAALAALSHPLLAVRSVLLDRASVQIVSALLPSSHHLRQVCFSDCRLDLEMLRLLRKGLEGSCTVEAVQIEWNPFELLLPTSAEMDSGIAELGVELQKDAAGEYSLEARQWLRHQLQSKRHLRAFRDRLVTACGGTMASVGAALDLRDEAPLSADAFHGVFDKLGVGGSQVTEVFEVLVGLDYESETGQTSLGKFGAIIDTLPAFDETESCQDPIGDALAIFLDGECLVESLSLRACAISWYEIQPVVEALKACPWQLRGLNLWDNHLCDRSARLIASALNDYRGLEFLGLGRNRITDAGLLALCEVFKAVNLDEAAKAEVEKRIKDAEAASVAKAKAAAKAKGKAAPKASTASGRERREAQTFAEVLDEMPPVVEGGEATYRTFTPSELKLLCLSENPIQSTKTIESLQPFGPKGVELLLKQTVAAQGLIAKRPELAGKERRAYCPGGEGWVIRVA